MMMMDDDLYLYYKIRPCYHVTYPVSMLFPWPVPVPLFPVFVVLLGLGQCGDEAGQTEHLLA